MNSTLHFSFVPSLFLIAASAIVAAEPLTEQKALLAGLEHRYEIRILSIENRIDSLNVETAKTAWLPQVNASAGVAYHPYDTSGITLHSLTGSSVGGGSAEASIVTGETLSVAQHLPGGGTVGGSFLFNNGKLLRGGDTTKQGSSLELNFTQPLLREGLHHDAVAYTIQIARLENRAFTLGQKKLLLSYCSDIRNRFWSYYESKSLATLYKTELAYAEKQLAFEQTRFSIGMSAPLDTLSARLSYINALSRLHDAESDELQTRDELAFYAGMGVEAVLLDSALSIDCAPLPAPDDMIKQVEQFDPQLRIFETIAERLDLTLSHTKNSLFPRVDIGASWRRTSSESSPGPEAMISNSVIGLIASYALPVKPRKLTMAQTSASIEKNDLDRTQYREELKLRLRNLNRSWERERRAIEIATAAQNIARETLVATRAAYTAGTSDRLSLDKADNDYRSSSIDLLQKQILMKQLEITFDEMTGKTLTSCGVVMQ